MSASRSNSAAPDRTGSQPSVRTAVGRLLFPRNLPRPGSPRSILIYSAKGLLSLAATATVFLGGLFRVQNRRRLDSLLVDVGFSPPRPIARLATVSLSELPGDDCAIRIHEPLAADGNVTLLELLVVARITAARQPSVVLEIGTFDGRTTLNLAANTAGNVITLDLPRDAAQSTKLSIDPSDAHYIDKAFSGARFLERPERARITQLFGDSASFDFTPWNGQVDLVFIDGAHSREYVLSDTERALQLLRPNGGIILWHDYDASFEGVTLALHEIADRGFPVRHIEGTSLAIAFFGAERSRHQSVRE